MRLKNGHDEQDALVGATMLHLRKLLEEAPVVLFELIAVARDRHHEPFGNTGEDLKKIRLLSEDGVMHSSIRNVILSAVTGEGFDIMKDQDTVDGIHFEVPKTTRQRVKELAAEFETSMAAVFREAVKQLHRRTFGKNGASDE